MVEVMRKLMGRRRERGNRREEWRGKGKERLMENGRGRRWGRMGEWKKKEK